MFEMRKGKSELYTFYIFVFCVLLMGGAFVYMILQRMTDTSTESQPKHFTSIFLQTQRFNGAPYPTENDFRRK